MPMQTELASDHTMMTDEFNVLIVEDDRKTVSLLESTLTSLGCTVWVKDRLEAEIFATRRIEHIHAILVDLRHGNNKEAGLDIAQSMKHWYPLTPVVVITVHSDDLIIDYKRRLNEKESLPLYVDSVVPKQGLIHYAQIEKWFEELKKQSRLTYGEMVEVSEGYVSAVDCEAVRIEVERPQGLEEVSLDIETAADYEIRRRGQEIKMEIWATHPEQGARVEFRLKRLPEEEKRIEVEPD